MELKEETVTFFVFIIVGIIIGIIFDFFRSLRKVKKYKEKYVYFQDIMFFLIIGIVLSSVLIYKLQSELRLYLIFAVLLGIVIYISTISVYMLNFFVMIIKISNSIFKFIFLPLSLYKDVFMTIYNFLSKKSKKYCNKFYNMISYFYKQKIKKYIR